MVGLILNNVFIQALHVVVGEKVLNTLSNHAMCTIAFGAILTIIYFCFTLPRTLADLSWLSVFSAVTMFISVVLGMIFAGVEDQPFGYPEYGTQIISSPWAPPGTTFVTGMSAMLNIGYTLMYFSLLLFIPHLICQRSNCSPFLHRRNARPPRIPESPHRSNHLRNDPLLPSRRNNVLETGSIHNWFGLRSPPTHLQKNRILLRDPHHCHGRCHICECSQSLCLFPSNEEFETSVYT